MRAFAARGNGAIVPGSPPSYLKLHASAELATRAQSARERLAARGL